MGATNLLKMHAVVLCTPTYHWYQGRQNLDGKLVVRSCYQDDLLALLLLMPDMTVDQTTALQRLGLPKSVLWHNVLLLEPCVTHTLNDIDPAYWLHVRQWKLMVREQEELARDY